MKRTDITDLFPEASKDAIDKLLNINGADVNAAKSELDSLRRQLAAAQEEKSDSDELKEAKQQISQLQTELDSMKAAETIRVTREKVAGEKNVPVHLLTGETEEACAKQADELLAYVRSSKAYPTLPDGGEVGGHPKTTTKQQFKEWLDNT
ncbi:MAG: hypothetical protein IIZ96_05940 [Oscillospiraceae bacterium]|nr:hypothetical protein [Oscillospiraceae bacterium]